MMNFFKSEFDIGRWIKRYGFVQGDIQPIGKIWVFAEEWYGERIGKSGPRKLQVGFLADTEFKGPIWHFYGILRSFLGE